MFFFLINWNMMVNMNYLKIFHFDNGIRTKDKAAMI